MECRGCEALRDDGACGLPRAPDAVSYTHLDVYKRQYVIPLIGHNAVRREVMGNVARLATPAEQAKMEALVTAAMQAGAYGLSDGPFYIPSKYSNTAEIVGLAKAAAHFPDAIYISHIRDEGNYDIGVVAAVDEVITVARDAGITGVVTHIKVLGPQVWGKSAEVIARILSLIHI